MIRTLQTYVARELFKTFALAAIGLTLTFSLCGGVFNMIQAELLSSVQMLKMLMFILPVAMTLTLPVSAMFACAIVYGRLAADNEFDACRASGINIHRLLAPAFVLSLATGAFTFTFTNYVLPRFVEGLDEMVRKDLQKVLVQALSNRGYVKRMGYVLYARHANSAGEEGDVKRINIDHAAFLELEGESLTRCGTAQNVEVDFRTPPEGNPTVKASMFDVRGIDLRRNQFYEEQEQPFHSVEIPTTLKQKLKWLTLSQLQRYAANVAQLPTVQQQLKGIRNQIRDAKFYKDIADHLSGDQQFVRFKDNRIEYEIRARRVRQDRVEARPNLEQATIREWRMVPLGTGRNATERRRIERVYDAEKCTIKLKRGVAGMADSVQLYLSGRAVVKDTRDPGHPVELKDAYLDEVVLPESSSTSAQMLSDEEILGLPGSGFDIRKAFFSEPQPLGLTDKIEDARVGTRREVARLALEITSVIHSRLAFSVSVLVMLVLAAGLGVIFRGGQFLTAFVISFAPGLLVVVMNIMGRQLAENPNTQLIGISVIWGGIVLVGLADLFVVGWCLRR